MLNLGWGYVYKIMWVCKVFDPNKHIHEAHHKNSNQFIIFKKTITKNLHDANKQNKGV